MFCMALTMQAGLGMAPWQSGNSFIALGVACSVSALYAPRLIARYSIGTDAADRPGGADWRPAAAVRHLFSLRRRHERSGAGSRHGADRLWSGVNRPNSFYRIGMRDIRACDAGAGSAILSTLQQATLGLGPAILWLAVLDPGPARRR